MATLQQLEARIRGLERRLNPLLQDPEREALYEQQIATLREDFMTERRDRERANDKILQLQDQLVRVQRELNRANCRVAAMMNNRGYNQPPVFPRYVSDDGTERHDEEDEEHSAMST
jgi:chromosome segregation ATPase